MSVVVVASIHPLPEHRDEVTAAFTDTIAQVHAEDQGCQLYSLHDGEDRLVMIEKWASEEALAAHGRGPALVDLNARIAGKYLGEIDVQVLRPHPAGTAQQGTL
jgi:quinol monooxygenase YgiN